MTRQNWGANETVTSKENIIFPAHSILLLESGGLICYDKQNCFKEVLQSQNNQSGLVNFIIGGDGRTYEGCGWSCKSVYSPDNKTLTLGLIGT